MRSLPLIFILVFFAQVLKASCLEDSTKAESKRRNHRLLPHFASLQFAGNIGFLSAGLGVISKNDKYHLGFLYGYSPASISGVRIQTLTAKHTFHLWRFTPRQDIILLPYAGLGVSFDLDSRAFFTLPDNMPSGYYNFPKSVHAIAFAGVKYRRLLPSRKILSSVEFFIEATTVDAYVWYKYKSKEVKMNDILSLALGLNLIRK